MTTKNALCNELDDIVLNGDDVEKLTIPLNGHPPSSTTPTGATIMRSNIYSSGPLSSSNNNTGANGMVASNKHVTWRPDTPPSPTPNIYTVSFVFYFN